MSGDGDIESGEGIQFRVETLSRGENGIDLGKYKDEIVRFSDELFPNENIPMAEVVEGIEYAAAVDWEAIMLAFDGEQAIGYGSVSRLKEGNMALDSAYVSPPYRRLGVYSRLIQERVEFARRKGANSVTIEAISSNLAQPSLSKYGFQKINDPDAVGEIRYEKQLK